MRSIDIYLAEPRGFCAGVKRAIGIVESALEEFGAPVFVRHEIVHNKHVIADLEKKGAVFVEEISEAYPSRPLIFSAHGVPKSVIEEANAKGFKWIDATCPLVKKVHNEILNFAAKGLEIIIIGKKDHPEIIGTRGQVPGYEKLHIIASIEDAKSLDIDVDASVGFVTQTTLSIDDTKDIIEYLKKRFKNLKTLKNNDICYATTNRQKAVKKLVKYAPTVIILGSKNSSNSRQLREVAIKNGAEEAFLVDDAKELCQPSPTLPFKGREIEKIGVSAGASAPEYLVEELIEDFKKHYDKIKIHDIIVVKEDVKF